MGDKDESVQLDRLTENVDPESLPTSDPKSQLQNETAEFTTSDTTSGSPSAPFTEEPKPFERDSSYAWLNFYILVLVYLDIIASLCVGISLIAYYSQSAAIDTLPKTDYFLNAKREDPIHEIVYLWTDYHGPPKMGDFLDYIKNRDAEEEYRRAVFYYGIAISMMAAIFTPACILQFRKTSESCSYIWIYRFRPVLWVALGLSIAVTALTVVFIRYDYTGPKRYLILILLPIFFLRFVLWIFYIIYGKNVDYQDPRYKFWPYSTDKADSKDLFCC